MQSRPEVLGVQTPSCRFEERNSTHNNLTLKYREKWLIIPVEVQGIINCIQNGFYQSANGQISLPKIEKDVKQSGQTLLPSLLCKTFWKLYSCRVEQTLTLHPGWCGSVDWVRACKPKGCLFDSQSRYLPGLWAGSPIGGVRGNRTLMFLSLSFSLPPPL